ncbi:MAG: hypothetical protein WCI05_13215 [Myxococcales bacterium]
MRPREGRAQGPNQLDDPKIAVPTQLDLPISFGRADDFHRQIGRPFLPGFPRTEYRLLDMECHEHIGGEVETWVRPIPVDKLIGVYTVGVAKLVPKEVGESFPYVLMGLSFGHFFILGEMKRLGDQGQRKPDGSGGR